MEDLIGVGGGLDGIRGTVAFLRDGDKVDVYVLKTGSPLLASTSPTYTNALNLGTNFTNMNAAGYMGNGTSNTETLTYADGGVLGFDMIQINAGGSDLGLCAGVLLENGSGGTYRLGAFAKPDLFGLTEFFWASRDGDDLQMTSSSNLNVAFACQQATDDSLQGFQATWLGADFAADRIVAQLGGIQQAQASGNIVPNPTAGGKLPNTSGLAAADTVVGVGSHTGDQTNGSVVNPHAAYRIKCSEDVHFVGFDAALTGIQQKSSASFAKTADLNSAFTFFETNGDDFSPSGAVEELSTGTIRFRMAEVGTS